MNFLKFSFGIINILHIRKVLINDNKYKIFLNSNHFFGLNTPIMGYINSENDVIVINKYNCNNDCKVLEDWMDKL